MKSLLRGEGVVMRMISKIWLTACIMLLCSGGMPVAYGDWSQEWTQNYYSPETGTIGSFTKMEFFILPVTPGAPVGVTFAKPTMISSIQWISTTPNTSYSLLTGPALPNADLTTFFFGPKTAKFELDLVLWNGTTELEQQKFDWLGNGWANPSGTAIPFDPYNAKYDRASVSPIPPTILLVAAGFSVLLLRRRFFQV